MANFEVFVLFSSVFLIFMQLNNAVPFHGLKHENNAGKYNTCSNSFSRTTSTDGQQWRAFLGLHFATESAYFSLQIENDKNFSEAVVKFYRFKPTI